MIRYDEPLFRPPSEAYSAIIQATIGCSWNRCAFCEMYTSKQFRVRPLEDVKKDIAILANHYKGVKKVFVADGNAMVLAPSKLMPVLEEINKQFGRLQRISSYALPKDILPKSHEELVQLREAGLKLLYIGIESGDDEVLKMIHKGESRESTIAGIQKAHAAGIDTSVMVLLGLGGRKYSRQHAINSAEVINQTSPKYLSTLTLSYPYGAGHFAEKLPEAFEKLTIRELLTEQRLLIENIHADGIIFRSNHVSNTLNPEGVLSKDKSAMLETIDQAIAQAPEGAYPYEHGMF